MSLNNVEIIIHHVDLVTNQTHMEKLFKENYFSNCVVTVHQRAYKIHKNRYGIEEKPLQFYQKLITL